MSEKGLWELLWDYDPNGLIVFDADFKIQVVNPAFCAMFNITPEEVLGKHASVLFDDLTDFQTVREQNTTITGNEKEYPRYGLYLRHVIFSLKEQEITACIVINLTKEHQQQQVLSSMKQEMLAQVNLVIDKQMRAAQEIASLLGESTAEAKVSLLKVRSVLNEEIQ